MARETGSVGEPRDDAGAFGQRVFLRILPVGLVHQHRRMEFAIRIGDDHDRAQAGAFVELLAQRDARHEILPAQFAVDLDDARVVVRIPGVEDRRALVVVALDDEVLFLHLDERAFGHRVAVERAIRILRIDQHDAGLGLVRRRLGLARERDADRRLDAVLVLDRHVGPLEVVGVRDHAVGARRTLRLFGDARRGAADVEGAQRQLRARLADRLRGENADRLAEVDHFHRGQVAAVAHPADAALALAGEHRADLDVLDAGVVDRLRDFLVDQLAGLHQQLADRRTRRARADRSRLRSPRCRESGRAAARRCSRLP